MTAAATYFEKTIALLGNVRDHELDVIQEAAEVCASRIAQGGLVFLFGNGHSRMMCGPFLRGISKSMKPAASSGLRRMSSTASSEVCAISSGTA